MDGSVSSLTAAREARLRRAALKVVHAFLWPAMHVPLGPSPLGPPEGGIQNMVDRLVTEAVEHARTAAPEVEVSHAVVMGEPLTVLEAQSRAAELVVVGSRGMGGFVGLLVGTTAVHLAAHGRCPVLVVRQEAHTDGPIVLGVDGSAAGAEAVDFAFAEASLRKAPLVALHAWTTWDAPLPAPQVASMPYANPPGALDQEEETLVSAALAGRQEQYPDVAVEHKVVHAQTREALIEASRSQALLHHAHCPVAVVRGAGTQP
ncbi:universal stress protein [Streptomyces sp. NPDC050625]|uniref:universal stress protein n=1 Tax=Streptomyces sp. NPDC050625 TaxID=3154629 RepID=UPI003423E51D